jgi:2-hydroxy-3-oxopropionate reductase
MREFAAGVEARLHHKDYAVVIAEAHRLGVPLPVSGAVGQQLNALLAMGWRPLGHGRAAARPRSGRAA